MISWWQVTSNILWDRYRFLRQVLCYEDDIAMEGTGQGHRKDFPPSGAWVIMVGSGGWQVCLTHHWYTTGTGYSVSSGWVWCCLGCLWAKANPSAHPSIQTSRVQPTGWMLNQPERRRHRGEIGRATGSLALTLPSPEQYGPAGEDSERLTHLL